MQSTTGTIIQYLLLLTSITSSLSGQSATTMKSQAVILLALFAVSLAAENSTTKAPASSTAKTVEATTTKKTETKAVPEGRKSSARMEVSDSQLEMALSDKRYLQRQLKCTLGEAPCDPVGRRLRTLAPLVIRGSCPQCTPQEMRQIQKVLLHIQRNFPKEWARVVRTYQ